MSTTEALRTQLDALQAECNALTVENRRLREEHPTEAKELDLEQELVATREENVRLSQIITRLESTREVQEEKETAELKRSISSLTCEAEELREKLGDAVERLAEEHTALACMQSWTEVAETHMRELESDVQKERMEAELRELRKVAEERRKWEEREARLVRRIDQLEKETYGPVIAKEVRGVHVSTVSTDKGGVEDVPSDSGQETHVAPSGGGSSQNTQTSPFPLPHLSHTVFDRPSHTYHHVVDHTSPTAVATTPLRLDAPVFNPVQGTTPPVGNTSTEFNQRETRGGEAVVPVPTLAAAPLGTLSAVLLAQQLPSLPNFTGDQIDGDGESIDDWLERLELVAATCCWVEQAKLVNVAARLRGSASRFYRSCTPQQRSSYANLTAALRERFTPVRLQSVQSSKFHERRQRADESVDNYAQDLRKLFHQAYSMAQDAGSGAETMGRSVLAYQFVAGLKDKLKSKLVGQSGSFEELLCKARFEEARLREIAAENQSNGNPPKVRHSTPSVPKPSVTGGRSKDHNSASKADQVCYSCGGEGHFQRHCPLKGRGLPAESPGGGKGKAKRGHSRDSKTVSMVTTETKPDQANPSTEQNIVDTAVEQVMATMHGIETLPTQSAVTLGPVLHAVVKLDSKPVEALIDTGSPVSIVSLDFFLQAAAEGQLPHQSPTKWAEDVRKKLQPTTVSLRNYGGSKLTIVSQVKCKLTCNAQSIETVLQVQKGAAEDLLLGTDVLPRLGFSPDSGVRRWPLN